MILRELVLQDFRSYGPRPIKVELDRGLLLFEGDIGSGKSSILYAIEFALFGLGELDAKSLLRTTANTAKVELAFTVDGQEYRVTRTIERKRGVKVSTIQTRGWLEEPSGKVSELSPTELRSRILQILNFKEKHSSKASSRIYRYAIFTPQELMKEVLAQRPEDRLETLRRAFGIEDYSFAISNTEIVENYLENQIEFYSKLSENLPAKQADLDKKKSELKINESELREQTNNLQRMESELEEAKAQYGILESQVRTINSLQALIPALEKNFVELQSNFAESNAELQRARELLREIQNAERKALSLKLDYEAFLSLREKLRQLDGLTKENQALESKISEIGREIFSREAALKAEVLMKSKRIDELEKKIQDSSLEIDRAVSLEEVAEKLKEKIHGLDTSQNRIEQMKTELGSLGALLASQETVLENIETKIKTLHGISRESKCPLCGQTLDEKHLQKVNQEYQLEMGNSRNEETSLRAKCQELESELKILESERNEKQEAKEKLEAIERQLSKIELAINTKETLALEALELEKECAEMRSSLDRQDFAKELKTELMLCATKRDSLARALKDYEELKARYQKLEDLRVGEEYQSAQAIASKKSSALEELSSLQVKCARLGDEISKSRSELEKKKAELEQSEPIILEFTKIKDKIKLVETECGRLAPLVQVIEERVRRAKEEEKALSREVDELHLYASFVSKSKGINSWLSQNFMPAISDIERYVLSSINEEFCSIFLRIFSILMVEEGDLSAKIDDSFAPVVEQGGYELEVQSLSGGERTAVALAYRLALNYMIKRANEALQTNLLILDEPTEGFSKEQIYRFRNALEELASDQVIIVTHERDLEPMADRVFRVQKLNGESEVTVVSP